MPAPPPYRPRKMPLKRHNRVDYSSPTICCSLEQCVETYTLVRCPPGRPMSPAHPHCTAGEISHSMLTRMWLYAHKQCDAVKRRHPLLAGNPMPAASM